MSFNNFLTEKLLIEKVLNNTPIYHYELPLISCKKKKKKTGHTFSKKKLQIYYLDGEICDYLV